MRKATLKTLSTLIDPAGFKWNEPEPIMGKRKRGGNGNCKPTMGYEEQLQAEGVEELDSANFKWSAKVFEGVPKKGEASSLNPYVDKLFANTWLAQNMVRACPARPRLPTGGRGGPAPLRHLPRQPARARRSPRRCRGGMY